MRVIDDDKVKSLLKHKGINLKDALMQEREDENPQEESDVARAIAQLDGNLAKQVGAVLQMMQSTIDILVAQNIKLFEMINRESKPTTLTVQRDESGKIVSIHKEM